MKKTIPALLFRKYPFSVLKIKFILALSVLVMSFIFIFKPFGFINYANNKLIASLGFGLVTFVCLFIGNQVLKRQMQNTFFKKWTLLHEITYTFFLLLLISFANLFYLSGLIANLSVSISTFYYTFFLTFSIGILPISTMVLIRYHQTLKNNLNRLVQGDYHPNNQEETKKLTFTSLNKTDNDFSIDFSNFLFAEAIKNHTHIYYIEDDKVKTKSLRNTLTNVLEQIKDNNNIFRCHRSFLVNLTRIKTAKGNSNGYKILLQRYEHPIPVSRKYTPEFQQIIY